MDSSKIQQINNLARELMKHGQATTMDEAMRKAQAQVDGQQFSEERQPAPPVSLGNDSSGSGQEMDIEVPEPPSQDVPEAADSEETAEDEMVVKEDAPSSEHETQMQAAAPQTHLSDDKWRALEKTVSQQQTAIGNMLDAVDGNTKNINAFNDKVNALIADLADVKSKLQKLLDSPTTPPLNRGDAQAGQTQIKADPSARPQTAGQAKDPSGHARSGNYNPEDVSIEKMFYCGPK